MLRMAERWLWRQRESYPSIKKQVGLDLTETMGKEYFKEEELTDFARMLLRIEVRCALELP